MPLMNLMYKNCFNFLKKIIAKKKKKKKKKRVQDSKVIKKKGDKLYAKWKGYSNSFNDWLDEKDIVQMSEYYPNPKSLGANIKVELGLSTMHQKQI